MHTGFLIINDLPSVERREADDEDDDDDDDDDDERMWRMLLAQNGNEV